MIDINYEFLGKDNVKSKCHLLLFKKENLVICSELPENKGTSITNWAEKLATAVSKEYQLEKENLVWVERKSKDPNPRHFWGPKDTFELVNFSLLPNGEFENPKWKFINPNSIQDFFNSVFDNDIPGKINEMLQKMEKSA